MASVCKVCGSENAPERSTCAVCGAALSAQSGEASVAGKPATQPTVRRVAVVLFPLLAIAGAWVLWSYIQRPEHPVIASQPVVADPRTYDSAGVTPVGVVATIVGSDIAIPLDAVKTHGIVRFEYASGTTRRWLLAYIATNGKLVTSVSLSEHCGSTDFMLKGDQIVCARCPSRWDMTSLEAYACCGKYYPDPIPSRVEGGNVLIARAEVDRWAGRM